MPVYTQINKTKLEIKVKIKSIFDKNLVANNMVVRIPCPRTTASVKTNCLLGGAKFEPQNKAIMWRIKKFEGDFQCSLQCELLLSEAQKDWVKPPLSLNYSIPSFTASGIRVRFLKVYEKSAYKTNKMLKSATKNGIYEHRL